MKVQMATQPVASPEFESVATPASGILGEPQVVRQSFASRIAFRFCFVYFALYFALTQISTTLVPLPNVDIPDPSTLWPFRWIVVWTAVHVFRTPPPSYADTGSGDKTFDWVLVFCLLVISTLATAVWSYLDRKRPSYAVLAKWFRLVTRIGLAGQMMAYGISKVIPTQMPYPSLYTLLERVGYQSPMGVLWASIGAAPAYETFVGSAELLGGILLIIPRTTTLGALVCLADMTEVFMLNMTYDVPVKLLSFHLILLSLFLLAADFSRLISFFFQNRITAAPARPPLFATRRANQIALIAQMAVGVWLLGMNIYATRSAYREYGNGRPKSVLYGIWDVDQLSIDGQIRSPLINDYGRWRRVVIDYSTRIGFQRMDDTFANFGATIDTTASTIALTKNDDKNWKGNLAFQRPAPDHLILDGSMDTHKVRMELTLFDRNKFRLVSRGFHWISEGPFNR